MLVIDRIKQIIEKEEMSVSAFEKKCGLSNNSIQTALKRKANLKDITLNSILEAFPQYDPTWLLTGKGKMIESKIKKVEVKPKEKNSISDKLVKENALLKSKLIEIEKILTEEKEIRIKESKRFKKIKGLFSFTIILILSGAIVYQLFFRPYNNDRLFNKFYQSYDAKYDNSHNLLQAIMNYQQGNYNQAIKFFKKSDSLTVSEKFYLAISYNEQGEYDKAIDLLSEIKKSKTGYIDDANWYLGLCYLKIGETEMAMEEFDSISKGNSPYKEQANQIIEKMHSNMP